MLDEDFDRLLEQRRVVRTVMKVDVVESTRHCREHEPYFVYRWLQFIDLVEKEILPKLGGVLVRTQGDDMLIAFESAGPAVRAALAIQELSSKRNEAVPENRKIRLRIGAHTTRLVEAKGDLLGHGVNVAALIAKAVASPDEIIVTSSVRDQVTSVLDAELEDLGESTVRDADLEDLGESEVRDLPGMYRLYRVGPPGLKLSMASAAHPFHPSIAVIPFECKSGVQDEAVLGEILADDVISWLAQGELDLPRVISRLSTTQFKNRAASLEEIGGTLGANYVLSGSYRVSGDALILDAALAQVDTKSVLWGNQYRGSVQSVLRADEVIVEDIVAQVRRALFISELRRARSAPLPTLKSYTLLLAAIALMHQGKGEHFMLARRMLDALVERIRRQPVPYAWLAKWHVLSFNRGYVRDAVATSRLALDATKRALDLDPDCALALTVDGFAHTNLLKDFSVGAARYERALAVKPNDSLGRLFLGTLHAFKGEGPEAVEEVERALRLSPIDPMRYYYESLAATAYHVAGRYEEAITVAKASLKRNRVHQSTWRALVIAQVLAGEIDAAKESVRGLMALDPRLTWESYLESNPGGASKMGKLWAWALRTAGVPSRSTIHTQ